MKFTHHLVYNKNLGSNAAKSIFIAILMISMSLSMGFMGDNNPPWSTESTINNFDDSTDIMQTSGSSPSISYPATTLGLEKDVSMSALTPVNSGGAGFEPMIASPTSPSAPTSPQSLALDSNGYRHLAIYDLPSHNLKYASDSSGSWVETVLSNPNDVGEHNSIAIDSNDVIHLVYFGYLNPGGTGVKNLMYSSCSSLCDQLSSWSNIVIDDSGDVGK